MYDVLVVGASVSGLRTGELISSKGYKVLILEEHKKIGRPLKCAGLVSWRILEFFPHLPKEIIVNVVKKAKIFSPTGNFFELKSKNPVYVIDREKFDRYLAKRALKSECEIKLATTFKNLFHKENCIKVLTNRKNFETKLIVGADGSNSLVARKLGLEQPKNLLVGIQGIARGNFESDCVELWFGQKVAPNFFAWVIPESEKRARIGLATKRNPKFYFENFLKKRVGIQIKPNVYGLIRFGLMKRTVAERVFLVGDSACMVKPLSCGGIVYSLIGSEICAKACFQALEKGRFDFNFLKKIYENEWKKKLGKPIQKGFLIRKILSKLSDLQLNFLFSNLKFGKKFLERLDMDFLS